MPALYLHIPFCAKKCRYCDFLSFAGCAGEEMRRYIGALAEELALLGGAEGHPGIETAFFGGGTPTLLPEGEAARVLDAVRQNFALSPHAEITIEANPGTLTQAKLAEYRAAGINRLSLGVQSFDDGVLRAAGINYIIAVDGNEDRLKIAEKLGAKMTICFKRPDEDTLEKRVAKVKAVANGVGVDFAYQCTGAPAAAADIYSYIRRGGGMCEMGFFVNNGEYQVNPHLAMCNKEINIVGSWDYSAEDYPKTMAFLKQCKEMNIPIEDLITHSFPLDQMNEAMETNVAQKGIKICYIAK